MTNIGQIVWAVSGDITVREADGAGLEAGDLLVWEGGGRKFLMQVTSLEHGSATDRRTHEMLAGMRLDGGRGPTEFYESGLHDYRLAHARPLAVVGRDGRPSRPKDIPPALGAVRRAAASDLAFLPGPGRVFLRDVRSGSKAVAGESGLHMDAERIFSHHILVPATTGRGKSNLIKCMLWGLLGGDGVGALVLDAHGEYHRGLSGHPRAASKLVCYSASPAAGHLRLAVNIRSITPHHFHGPVEFREPQERMRWDLWGACRKEWIVRLFDEAGDEDVPEPQKITRTVLRQKVRTALGIRTGGTFETGDGGESTISDMVWWYGGMVWRVSFRSG